jgi:hypothetical protein
MNVDWKVSIDYNNLRQAPLWQLYLHCGTKATSSPGIIYIVYHQVLRHSSENGTSSISKSLQAKVHITKLNKLTESEVSELTKSTVNETAWAILKRQASQGISFITLQLRLLFNFSTFAILTVMADKTM